MVHWSMIRHSEERWWRVYRDAERSWTRCQYSWWINGLECNFVSLSRGLMTTLWSTFSRYIWKVAPSTWPLVTAIAPSTACWLDSPWTLASTGSTLSHEHIYTVPSSQACWVILLLHLLIIIDLQRAARNRYTNVNIVRFKRSQLKQEKLVKLTKAKRCFGTQQHIIMIWFLHQKRCKQKEYLFTSLLDPLLVIVRIPQWVLPCLNVTLSNII